MHDSLLLVLVVMPVVVMSFVFAGVLFVTVFVTLVVVVAGVFFMGFDASRSLQGLRLGQGV